MVLPLRCPHSSKAKTDKDMDEEDDQSSIVQSLRERPGSAARPLLDQDDNDHTDSVEVLFAETARAQRRATDLESASPHFACVIGAFAHRGHAGPSLVRDTRAPTSRGRRCLWVMVAG